MRYHSNRPAMDITRLTELARGKVHGADPKHAAQATAALETLTDALRSPDLLTRILAADSLFEVGDATCVEPLLGVLNDDEALVRKAALGRIGDADSEALLTALRDPAESVRVAAAETLGNLHDLRAVPHLCQALRDGCPEVVAAAATTLSRLRTPDAVPALCRELIRSGRALPDFVYGRPDASWTWEERRQMEQKGLALVAMVNALREIGEPSAAGALCEMIGESFWRSAAVAAAEGLEQLLPQLSMQQLAVAIPVLKNQLPPWTFESTEHRQVFRRVLQAVQSRYRELGSLPVPSDRSTDSSTQLPRPAAPTEPSAQDFPIPAPPTTSTPDS